VPRNDRAGGRRLDRWSLLGGTARKGDRDVDIVEHEEPLPASVTASGTAEADETIFSVLAGRARTRARSHLWLTAGIGGIDAIALIIGKPSLWWLAAACGAVGAYGVWGLIDRSLAQGNASPAGWGRRVLRLGGDLTMVGGFVMATAAVLGFLAVTVGRVGPPG
jgi:hypothetical protein